MRLQGNLTDWQDERGFGFISVPGRADRVFVHINAFASPKLRPQQGDALVFVLGTGKEGKPCALKVQLQATRAQVTQRQRHGQRQGGVRPLIASLFLLALVVTAFLGLLPVMVVLAYGTLSLFTWLLYARDKRAARRGAWRTTEDKLQVLAFFGGWPGALFAQEYLRHKSRKTSFQIKFWSMVALNLATLGGLMFSHQGQWLLQRLDVISRQLLHWAVTVVA